MAKLFGAPLRK